MGNLGKYRIDGLIAEGGMARIYRAKTEGVGGVEKVVALKCLKESMNADDNFVKMMRDEARITVRMTHKNIGQVFGFEHVGETYFMVMEYVDGINLADLCQYLFGLNRVFPIEAAVFIVMEICSGLSYAHRMTDDNGMPLNIVHRDVNPQNVCISKEGEVKLIDFGIAKAQSISNETQAGTIKGKFNYMSPEQARGERLDQRTDVFALGAILYELLCGHMLYPLSLDDMRLRTKTRMADFVPIESYMPDIPQKLLMILNKALTRDINQRFATSRDFLLALTQFYHDSCKIYDSLNLSMLVAKCIENRHRNDRSNLPGMNRNEQSNLPGMNRNEQSSLPGMPRVASQPHPVPANIQAMGQQTVVTPNPNQRRSQPLMPATSPLDISSEFSMESSDTAVLSAEEAQKLADVNITDESKTNIYQKPDFSKAPEFSDMPSSILSRSVDLNIEKPSNQETVIVKLGQNNDGLFKSIYHSIISMNERTLIVIALILAVAMVVAIVFLVNIDSPKDNSPILLDGYQESE